VSNRVYEIAFALGAQIQSSFNSTFANANNQIEHLGGGLSSAIGTAAKFGAAITLAGAAAALAIGGLAVNASEDLQKSLNGVQAETGIADEAMAGMREGMLAIYNNNFGESFEDIGNSMGIIASQSDLTGKALQDTTQNALMLRDTFEMEVSESFRGANMLMTQFGITSEEAYSLIAQGAQEGLNKNENLLDSVNEYSAHFKSIGLDSEDMFNMFANGAKTGVFDIDKLGDAVKEFGIRSKDGSEGSMEAFTSIGLDAEKMTKDFGAGGKAGKAAFQSVVEHLGKIKDPLKQNTAGVALFGTMWEDMGAEAVLAMGNTKGEIETASDALTRINAGKYNTFGEAMQGIKRNIETGVLIPIGDALLPALKSFSGWINANMPQIKDGMLSAMTTVGDILKGAGDVITNYVIPPLESLWAWVQPNMPLIKDSVKIAMDGIQTAFSTASDGISALMDWCVKYQAILIPLAAGIAAGGLAFGIYSAAIGIAAFATTAWAAITSIATIAGTAFGAVLAFITSPIGIVVIAIGLLVAAGVLLYRNWDTVKTVAMNVFGAIGSFIGGVVDGIASAFRGMVNGVIGGLNSMIGALNGIHFSVPDWVPVLGGKDFGFSIPQIPMLANGGITNGPMHAIIGDNPGGKEVVSPLSDLQSMIIAAVAGVVTEKSSENVTNNMQNMNKYSNAYSSLNNTENNDNAVKNLSSYLENTTNETSVNNSEQPIQITYSPQIIIQGNADKAVIEEANQKGFDDFKIKYKALQNRNQRLSFARG
jgi:phage-related minor tail protein